MKEPWKSQPKYHWHYHQITDFISLPIHKLLLCVRDTSRVVGYEEVGTGRFVSFQEHAESSVNGQSLNVCPRLEKRCLFTLDIWKGVESPWLHVGSGHYRGYYELPPISKQYWKTKEIGQGGQMALVNLNQPNTIEASGYSVQWPGVYLAQSCKSADGFIDWQIHHPGYHYRSTDQLSIPHRKALVPSFTVSHWIPLPDPGLAIA